MCSHYQHIVDSLLKAQVNCSEVVDKTAHLKDPEWRGHSVSCGSC